MRVNNLDANVKLIRVLGISPETTTEDIKETFSQVGIGEVVNMRKGLFDPKRMPGVTNGTWLVRIKIIDPDKPIPPYIIRREEGNYGPSILRDADLYVRNVEVPTISVISAGGLKRHLRRFFEVKRMLFHGQQ